MVQTQIKGSQALLFIRISILEQENKLQLLKLLYLKVKNTFLHKTILINGLWLLPFSTNKNTSWSRLCL